MSQVPAGLHADDEVGRSPRRPRLEGLRLGQAVEGVVDLNGGEVAGGGVPPPPLWARHGGVEGVPLPVPPPTRAHPPSLPSAPPPTTYSHARPHTAPAP